MGKIRPSSLVICLLVLTVAIPTAQAQWTTNGNLVAGASGNQMEPLIVSDGAGGAIILYETVWSGTDSDLYIQRIGAGGVVQWTDPIGRAICTTDGLQTWADIVADGAGGAIMTWTGSGSVYIQKVNSTGDTQWDADGRFVNAGANSSRIVLNGTAGSYISWEEWTFPTTIVVQRLSINGFFGWPDYVTIGGTSEVRLVSDDAGGVVAGWENLASASDGNYVRGQRLDSSGTPLWASHAVSPSYDCYFQAQIASDGAGGGIWVWQHIAGTVAQRVDGAGALQWGTDGVNPFPSLTAPNSEQVISDGAGGAIVVVQEGLAGADLYMNRILADGTLDWGPDGLILTNGFDTQQSPQLASDGSGGAYIVWRDGRFYATTGQDIFAQHVDPDGNRLWTPNGWPICVEAGNQINPRITATGTSSAIVAWEDDRNGASNVDIYAQAIHFNGSIGDPPIEVDLEWPLANSIHVPLDGNIAARFNAPVNPATLAGNTFVARGSLTGVHEGYYAYHPVMYNATLVPDSPFDPGEVVSVVVTRGIESAGGSSLIPFGWSFTTATTGVAGEFLAAESNAVQVRPVALCAADLDGDNDMDLVAVNQDSDSVSILNGIGDGTFGTQVTYPTGSGPRGVAAADVSKDGDLDLITANYLGSSVTVFHNNGTGQFPATSTYLTGAGPASVCVGDFNNDGHVDLATANLGSDDISVLFNMSNGNFHDDVLYAAGDNPFFITCGDLDGDGYTDLVTANLLSDDISVFLNRGTGYFHPKVDIYVGDGPMTVHAADLDKDGDLDLVAAATLGNQMVVLFNNGDATFGAPVTYATGAAPYGGLPTDVDGDEDLDLVHSNGNSDNIWVRLNDGSGSFGAETVYAAGNDPIALVAADFDEDGALDLASANRYGDDVTVLLNHSSLSGVELPEAPSVTSLGPNVPNPFNPLTRIDYAVKQDGHVRLVIYDARGREIATLVDEHQTAQQHSVQWDGRNESGGRVASGVYFYKLFAGDFEETRKMVLVK